MASSPSRDEHDDSFSSNSARMRPRAKQSTIPLSVAYGAAPDTSIATEHGSASRPRVHLSPSLSPSVAPATPTPEPPSISAQQRYAGLRRTNQLKEELRRQNEFAGAGPGYITSPPVPSGGGRDTSVGAATAVLNAGGVGALQAAYGGARAGPSRRSVREQSVPLEDGQDGRSAQDEQQQQQQEARAAERKNERGKSPLMDAFMERKAQVTYLVRHLAGMPEVQEEELDETEEADSGGSGGSRESWEWANRFVQEGGAVANDKAPPEGQAKSARRKKKADVDYEPVEEEQAQEEQEDMSEEDAEGENDEDYVPNEQDAGPSKKTRKRKSIPHENRAYRPSSEDLYFTDEDVDNSPAGKRKRKAKPPLVLPSHTDPKMGLGQGGKVRRKSGGKRKKGEGEEEGEEGETAETAEKVTEKPVEKPKRAKQAKAPTTAQAPKIQPLPTPALSVPSTSAHAARSLSPVPPFSRGHSPFIPPPPPVVRGVSPTYTPLSPPPSNIQNGSASSSSAFLAPPRPDFSHADSAASVISVERHLAEPSITTEKAEEEQQLGEGEEDVVEPGTVFPGMTLVANIFYTLVVYPLIGVANLFSTLLGFLGSLVATIRASPGSVLFWLILLLGLYLFRNVLTADSPLQRGYWEDSDAGMGMGRAYEHVMDTGLREQVAVSERMMHQMRKKADGQAEELARTQNKLERLEAQLAEQRRAPPPVERPAVVDSRLEETMRELADRVARAERELAHEKERASSLEASLRSYATVVPALEDKLLSKVGVGELRDEVEKKTSGLKGQVDAVLGARHALEQDVRRLMHDLPAAQHVAALALDEVQRLAKVHRQSPSPGQHASGAHEVYSVLAKHAYDTDLRRDYGLFENGGRVLPIYTSKTYDIHRTAERWPRFASIWSGSGAILGPDPSVVLEKDLVPGRCWAFGTNGTIGILLGRRLYLDDVVIASPPVSSLMAEGSTPKSFDVWGYVEGEENEKKFAEYKALYPSDPPANPSLHHHDRLLHFGSFEYDKDMPPIQTFPLRRWPSEHQMEFGLLVLTFNSNYGNDFTCLYRIGVHGEESGTIVYDLRE